MEPRALADIISKLSAQQPVTDALEASMPFPADPKRKYASQREHLVGWLNEYNGPGYYGRKNPGKDAKYFYNHFRCAPGLVWLAEALGEDPTRLESSSDAIKKAGRNPSSQCAAHRKIVPWSRIEELLEQHKGDVGSSSRVGRLTSRLRPRTS